MVAPTGCPLQDLPCDRHRGSPDPFAGDVANSGQGHRTGTPSAAGHPRTRLPIQASCQNAARQARSCLSAVTVRCASCTVASGTCMPNAGTRRLPLPTATIGFRSSNATLPEMLRTGNSFSRSAGGWPSSGNVHLRRGGEAKASSELGEWLRGSSALHVSVGAVAPRDGVADSVPDASS